jgi:hypothetical protein
MRHECYFCHIKTIERLVRKFNPEALLAEEFIFSVHELLAQNREESNIRLATDIHRLARIHFNNTNLYAEEKLSANDMLLKNYSHWKEVVAQSEDPFFTAAKLSVIGNIIDYGAHSINGSISGQIESLFRQDLKIDRTRELQNDISKAKSILFLGDNCGEIVFDKLFIETIKHPNVTYAVRGNPVINDATIEDAQHVGMDDVCRVISNGFDAPSTLVGFCSDEFMTEYDRADLIISKGQGNLEGLLDTYHKNVFFLLIAKCVPMAELLAVEKNDMVITKLYQQRA